MKVKLSLLASLLVLTVNGDKNGGVTCAACGIIAGWFEQYAVANGKTGKETIEDICRFLPTDLERVCALGINMLSGPIQETLLYQTCYVKTLILYSCSKGYARFR